MFVPNDVLNASLYGDLYDDDFFDNYQAMENIFDFVQFFGFLLTLRLITINNVFESFLMSSFLFDGCFFGLNFS